MADPDNHMVRPAHRQASPNQDQHVVSTDRGQLSQWQAQPILRRSVFRPSPRPGQPIISAAHGRPSEWQTEHMARTRMVGPAHGWKSQ
jgi:hypothetical protein